MVGKSAWWKVTEKQRREKKKTLTAVYWDTSSSGSIMVLTVLVLLSCSEWIQHHPSKVEQVWAEHLGSNNSWTSGVPLSVDTCHWLSQVLWWCGAVSSVPAGFIWIHRDAWSRPTHHQPPFSCHLSEICFQICFPSNSFLSKNLEA